MAKWSLALIVLAVVKIAAEAPRLCRKRTSIQGGEELICHNATAPFFAQFDLVLNKTHWFTCANCSLDVLDEKTFNAPRNNVNIVHLIQSKIRTIKAFAFRSFLSLKVLNLRGNAVENISPRGFTNLTRLHHLDLSHNNLKILHNNLFAELENLDLLNLNHNKIFYIQPNAFAGLYNLKYLYLNDNDLEKLEGFNFKHLHQLMLLYLENNHIYQIDSFAFSNMTKLAALYLNNNSLTYLVPYNFKPLSTLTDLQLRQNNLTEIQTSSFNGLKSLRSLYLGRNQLKTVKPYGFVGLTSLETLEMIDNHFKVLDLEYFKGLENLNILWLEHNQITNLTIDFKSDVLNSLRSLSVNDNNLTAFNYKLLYNKMPTIRDLFIANNSWKCEFLVNMFNFFQGKSVNLCVTSNCDVNRTKNYIEDVCAVVMEEKQQEDGLSTDFSTESGAQLCLSCMFLKVCLLVVWLCLK